MKLQKHNLQNIKNRFEAQTGVILSPSGKSLSFGKVAVLAATFLCCVVMAAFSYPIFSPLDGDSLSLSGSYEGDGIVSVFVENGSEKELRFQHQVKLYNWGTGEEIPKSGEPVFYNAVFPAGTSGVMTIDLSAAYDIPTLETTVPGDAGTFYYYLLLTNRDFLFGQDWQCSFSFAEPPKEAETEETPIHSMMEAQTMDNIAEELRFYFQEDYWDQIPAMNEANFSYLQKVREVLQRRPGILVRPVDPMLIVGDVPEWVVFDENIPPEMQNQLLWEQYSSLDGYRRVVGSQFSGTDSDYLLQLFGMIPQQEGQLEGGVTMIPLIYLATYETAAVSQPDAYAFLYGQCVSLEDLEGNIVYEDEQYTVYQVTDYFYTDLDAYIDYFLTTTDRIWFNENIRQRLHNIHDFFREKENVQPLFYYNLPK